jgi:hypothetical protein
LRESGSRQHAAQRIDEQRQAEALVRGVRAAERRQQTIEDDPLGHRLALLRGAANLLHRDHSRSDVQDDWVMTLGGEAVREGVGAKDRRPTAGRGDQRDEVRAGEPDQAGVGGEPGVGPGDKELPVPDRRDGDALALAGTLDTPVHRPGRHVGPTPAVSVEQDRAVRLV